MSLVKNALSTDQRILLATARIIDKSGEASIRISDICKSLNITAPSIYHFFGDREGLIEATQAHRYSRGQQEFVQSFASATFACKGSKEFIALLHRTIRLLFSADRIPARRARTEVLGSAQYRPGLAKKLAAAQEVINRSLAEPLRYAQAKGWINQEFDPVMFAAWVAGVANSRRMIELAGEQTGSPEWDAIAARSICGLLGIPEPKRTSHKRSKRANS
jgi:AcrR family transcriptional regulator